nr:spore coat protein U domain-containing protein [Mesorhizobium sp.]
MGTDTLAGTGTGAEQTYPVYGQVPVQETSTAGTYADVITVTLTY